MGRKFSEYDMYPASREAIRNRYPENDGWKIHFQDRRKDGYRPDFVIEKDGEAGLFWDTPKKKVIAEVKAEAIITMEHAQQLTVYARNHGGGKSKIVGLYLIVPSGANMDRCRPHIAKHNIEVIFLRNYQV